MAKSHKWLKGLFLGGFAAAAGATAYKTAKTAKVVKQYDEKFMFTGKNLSFKDQVFDSTSYAVVASGMKIDFSGATLYGNVGRLDLYGEASGIKIIVPETWCVESKGTLSRSHVSNDATCEDTLGKPVLYLNYNLNSSALHVVYEGREDLESDLILDEVKDVEEDKVITMPFSFSSPGDGEADHDQDQEDEGKEE